MNQVISFERVVYFGFIQEQYKDPKLMNHSVMQGNQKKQLIAFQTRIEKQKARVE